MWIKREIQDHLERNRDFIQILTGPRQCGKSSLLLHLEPSMAELNLDVLAVREMAQTDPELLLQQYIGKKILIDEAQLAPQLFHEVKRIVDLRKRAHAPKETLFRITGSNQILMDRTVKESLAGRAIFFELNTLSIAEISASLNVPIQEMLFKGGWPELYVYPETSPVLFLNSYISSYIEKDIVLSAGIQKQNEFLKFARLLAGRTAQLLNASELSKEVGVESSTIKDWISILEKMKVIVLVEPYFSNFSKRMVKSPKVYFIDTGLACRLQGWTDPHTLLTSPSQGALFETLVFSEIYKTIRYNQLEWKIYHWRTKDGEEIDFLIEKDKSNFVFIEAKLSTQNPPSLEYFPEVKKVFKNTLPPVLLCHMDGESVAPYRIPIKRLNSYLKERGLPL